MADIQFNLRIPEELKEKIRAAAIESGRSINSEAQMRLEQSFNEPIEFNPNDKDMITKIVANSMQMLLESLHDEGVEGNVMDRAIHNMANKKAP